MFKWSPHGLCARARGFACGTRARGTRECALPRHCGCWSLSGQVGQQCRTAGRSSCPGASASVAVAAVLAGQPSAQPFPSRLPAAASAPVARVARRRRPLPLAAGCRCRTCRLRQRDDASNKKANAARQRPEPNVRAMRRSCRRWARAISSGRGVPAASRKHRAGVRHKSGVRTFGWRSGSRLEHRVKEIGPAG